MFSNKHNCPQCKSKIKEDYDFCPHCGQNMRSPEENLRDYGLLGKHDHAPTQGSMGGVNMGITDKLISSIFTQLMKSLESQVRQNNAPEIQQLPNGIQIKVGMPQAKPQRQPRQRKLSDDQMKRMSGAPRIEAKSDVRRLSDKVVYELKAPGIDSIDDVFVSKVESGYEVKAIGKNKVYLNSLPVDLPLRSYGINDKGIILEFGTQ